MFSLEGATIDFCLPGFLGFSGSGSRKNSKGSETTGALYAIDSLLVTLSLSRAATADRSTLVDPSYSIFSFFLNSILISISLSCVVTLVTRS